MANADQDTSGLLRVAVFIDPAWVWRWQGWLVKALAARGHQVDLCPKGSSAPIPGKLKLLLQLEKLIYRMGGENASDLLTLKTFEPVPVVEQPARTGYDLVIDLAGDTSLAEFKCRRFRPLYDNRPDKVFLLGLLLDGHAPRLSLDDSALPEPRRLGLCAIEEPQFLSRGLDNVFSRMAGLLLNGVDELAGHRPASPPDALSGAQANRKRRTAPLKVGRFLVGTLGAKIINRLNKLVRARSGYDLRWGMGWRFTKGQSVRQTGTLDISNYQRLKDDAKRFYADPFVLWRDGVYHVFVEEFPFETQKGIISHFTVNENGEASRPKMVLSRPYHLSYPNVFEQDGEVYMIPESSGNKRVELYRATRFPTQWVLEKVLIDDIVADDVTLMRHDDHLWMFAAVRDWQSSSWDALGLFYADDLFAAWRPHQSNPVLLDARAARPAGAMYRQGGELWRPVQDCSTGYGAGLSLCRVDRLDMERFEQTVVHHFAPEKSSHLTGLHTLNEDKGLEVIDFYGRL